MSGGWLCWKKDCLDLVNQDNLVESRLYENIQRDRLQKVGFAVDLWWLLMLPTPKGLELLISSDGKLWEKLPEIPVTNNAHSPVVKLDPQAGLFLVVELKQVHFCGADRVWRSLPLPEGATWVEVGTNSEWWAIGSQPSNRNGLLKTDREVALWYRAGLDNEWINLPIRASWWDTYWAIQDGGFEELQGIHAKGNPLVLASECAWFLDDPSWFLFTQKSTGEFAIQKLLNRSLTQIENDVRGRSIILTTDGEIWDWNGSQWKPRGIAVAISKALGKPANIGGLYVHLALAENEMYGVVTQFGRGVHDQKIPIRSTDSGRSWEIVNLSECYGISPVGVAIAAWAKSNPGS